MAYTNSKGQTQSSLAEINITPLVDVVLVLLVIFMITAPVLQSGIEVAVPKTRTVREITEQRLVVTINRDQQVFLGDQPVNIHELAGRLHQPGSDPAHQVIYLRADERVPFGAFATVMDAVKQAGITNISIVTQPLDTKPAGGIKPKDFQTDHEQPVGKWRATGAGVSLLAGADGCPGGGIAVAARRAGRALVGVWASCRPDSSQPVGRRGQRSNSGERGQRPSLALRSAAQ